MGSSTTFFVHRHDKTTFRDHKVILPYVAVNKTSSLQIIKYRPSQRTKASEKHDICRNKGGKMVHFLPSVGGREEKKKKPMFQHGA